MQTKYLYPPDHIIHSAAVLAHEEDTDQVVGTVQGQWMIRAWEDPESDLLQNSFVVDSTGIKED